MAHRRRLTDLIARQVMLAAALFSGLLVVVVGIALYLRAGPLLASRPLGAILLGDTWLPSEGEFGLRPFVMGTFWVTIVATVLAAPISLLAAVHLAEYARPRTRAVVKPLIDLLAGTPSVVYGVWGVLVIVPFVARVLGPYAQAHFPHLPILGAEFTTGYCILSGGVVLAIMVCPVIVSIADETLRAVPAEYREASLALGATRLETVWRVVARKALPGLGAAVVLGVSRALGETMAVLMVVGNVAVAPKSVFDPAYPLPALIANHYGEMMSIPLYAAALLGAGFLLLVIVGLFNVAARLVLLRAVRRAV